MFVIQFKLEKETSGTYRYQEVDAAGDKIEQAWAKVGSLYVRKSAFEYGTKPPATLTVTIT